MDEFIKQKLEPKVIELNAKTISEKRGKVLVMASDRDYVLNEQIKMMPGVELVNPKSSLGKLLEKDDTILRAEDFLAENVEVPVFDYSMVLYKPLKVEEKKEEPKVEKPKVQEPIFVADDYREQSLQVAQPQLFGYQSRVSFSPEVSWYNQGQLENILKNNSANSYLEQQAPYKLYQKFYGQKRRA